MPRWVVGRALAIWFVRIIVEFILGMLRAFLLAPSVGDCHARQRGVFLESALILVVAYLFVSWLRARDRSR
jgi:hypothetical protein